MLHMSAKEYAASRGLPLATVRRLCKNKIIACLCFGRVYRIDVDAADAYFAKEAEAKAPRTKPAATTSYRGNGDFKSQLKAFRTDILCAK